MTIWIASGVLIASAWLPSGLQYLFALDSAIPGFALLCALILCLALTGLLGRTAANHLLDHVPLVILVMLAVVAHLTVTSLFFHVEVGRLALAVLLLGITIITASQLSYLFMSLPHTHLSRALWLTSVSFVLVAALGVAGLQPPSNLGRLKPMFPFTEPSHFALTFMPFLVDACARSRSYGRLLWLAVAVVTAVLVQSLSLLVGGCLAALVCLKAREIAIVAALVLSIGVLFVGDVDLAYFTARLDLSRDSGNLSSLVYLQGWDLAQESLTRTSGFGIGFMQLGYVPTNVSTADLVYRLAGSDQNLHDGSFTAAKMISEFGVFGIAMVGAIGMYMASSVLKLRGMAVRAPEYRVEMMAHSFIVGLSVDFFVRGIGYFSGTSLLFLASLFILKRLRSREKIEGTATIELRA